MNTTPPTVLFGKIDIEKLANYSKFNYFKVSDDIDIYTYPRTEQLQFFISNVADVNIYIQIPDCQKLIFTDDLMDDSVDTLLVFKKIDKVLGENTNQVIPMMLNTDLTFYGKLSEIVTAHLNNLFVKNKVGMLQILSLKIWVYQLMYEIFEEISESICPSILIKYKQDDIQKIRNLASSLKNSVHYVCPSLIEMAESVGMSPTKFKSIFKEVCHESPHQYILDLRLNQAKKLLKDKDLTISQIAYKVGFNHPSALTRLFKNKLGISPNEIFKR